VIDHDWEQESRLLESKVDEEREDPNYRERAKKKLPRIVFAIVVLLILTNVIGKLNILFQSLIASTFLDLIRIYFRAYYSRGALLLESANADYRRYSAHQLAVARRYSDDQFRHPIRSL
jgi:hypothetical protein